MSHPGLLPPDRFRDAVAALPLVSIDFCLTTADGLILLGLRRNAPARGYWFTPGGRIRKLETLDAARHRIFTEETGFDAALLQTAALMGAWDHLYPDSALDPDLPTHYINLPHRIVLPAVLPLPDVSDQHAAWRWWPAAEAAVSDAVHPCARPYAQYAIPAPHPVTNSPSP